MILFGYSRQDRSQFIQDGGKIRIIVDSDANNEMDDQYAIAYVLFNGDVFDVEGVTVNKTFLGGDIHEHYKEAERIVRLCGLYPDIPVYRGATGLYEDIVGTVQEDESDGKDAVDFIVERALVDDNRPIVLLAVGKLTNVALALEKEPSIASRVRVVWLGSNYPNGGEYNMLNDTGAVNAVLDRVVPFEIAVVRYAEQTGTMAVQATLSDVQAIMPGKGPQITTPVTGRHGGSFFYFGDYAVNLFEHIQGDIRPLFDMAAAAVIKNPSWADAVEIGAPRLENRQWVDRPDNPRTILMWENFDKAGIIDDFYATMNEFELARPSQ